MRLIAVVAHPDDAEIWCGETLTLHAKRGDAVRVCTLTYSEDSTRGKEALEGAKRMGCEVELLGFKNRIRKSEIAIKLRNNSGDPWIHFSLTLS